MSWREAASCRDLAPALFFIDDNDPNATEDTRRARTICGDCPVRVQCLDHAIVNNLTEGIFGGQTKALRKWVNMRYLKGIDEYRLALTQVMAELDIYLRKPGAERALQPRHRCERCPGWVPAGRHPLDRNGPDATCGLPSTFNKGCRCGPCRHGKSRDGKGRTRDRRKR